MSIENLKTFDPFADEGDPLVHASASEPPAAPAGRDRRKPHKEAAISDKSDEEAAGDKSDEEAAGDKRDEDIAPTLDPKAPEADEVDLDPFPYEDPLAETADVGSTLAYLHIRIQQRNGRKTLTTLQGLPKKYSEKKLLKAFKKEFACNGTVIADEKAGKIIQLQGDQRSKIMNFLVDEGVKKDTIMVHGF